MYKKYYSILKINENATIEEIKKAYKTEAKKYHPDINKDKNAEIKMKEINEAYNILLNKEKNKKIAEEKKTQVNDDKETLEAIEKLLKKLKDLDQDIKKNIEYEKQYAKKEKPNFEKTKFENLSVDYSNIDDKNDINDEIKKDYDFLVEPTPSSINYKKLNTKNLYVGYIKKKKIKYNKRKKIFYNNYKIVRKKVLLLKIGKDKFINISNLKYQLLSIIAGKNIPVYKLDTIYYDNDLHKNDQKTILNFKKLYADSKILNIKSINKRIKNINI